MGSAASMLGIIQPNENIQESKLLERCYHNKELDRIVRELDWWLISQAAIDDLALIHLSPFELAIYGIKK